MEPRRERLTPPESTPYESLNHLLLLRKVLKPWGAFPDDGAVLKLRYLALIRVAKRWTRPVRDWTAALNTFVVLFPDLMPV